MKQYVVTVRRHEEDELSDYVRPIPCKDFETAVKVKETVKERYLKENPTIKDGDDSRHIAEDSDTRFTCNDDYCADDIDVYIHELTLIESDADIEEVMNTLDEEGAFC